jgi:tRNA 2-selenouridine synthase
MKSPTTTSESPWIVPGVSIAAVLDHPDARVVDLRSPSEYVQDHLPGARNVPLFDDVERALVGTLYKASSPEDAFDEGRRILRERITPLVSEIARLAGRPAPPAGLEICLERLTSGGLAGVNRALGARPAERLPEGALVLHCWRGGLRSSSLVVLLRELGWQDVFVLEGGYKSYRKRVLAELAAWSAPPAFVLRGSTGVGKTLVLREIEGLRPGLTLDLEGLAGHRSSILGMVGLEPCTQKVFDTRLAERLRGHNHQRRARVAKHAGGPGQPQRPTRHDVATVEGRTVRVGRYREQRQDRTGLVPEQPEPALVEGPRSPLAPLSRYVGRPARRSAGHRSPLPSRAVPVTTGRRVAMHTRLRLLLRPNSAMKTLSTLALALGSALLGTQLQQTTTSAPPLSPAQRALLGHMELVQAGPGGVPTILFSGVNLQVVNGLGATNGNPASPFDLDPANAVTNGAGNLILGYNERPLGGVPDRSGSHNLIVGPGHDYRSFGGAVLGLNNEVEGPLATVLGGSFNNATGQAATVAGGTNNLAGGQDAAVGGGGFNWATGDTAFAGGGFRCAAVGFASAVSGGYKSVATGDAASVNGGDRCQALGNMSTVSGGSVRIVSGQADWAAGSLFEDQ